MSKSQISNACAMWLFDSHVSSSRIGRSSVSVKIGSGSGERCLDSDERVKKSLDAVIKFEGWVLIFIGRAFVLGALQR
jgi:hypothetical protein